MGSGSEIRNPEKKTYSGSRVRIRNDPFF